MINNTSSAFMKKLGSSRRVVVEEKLLLKQTMLFLGLFVLLLTLFFFVIVPFLIRVTAGPEGGLSTITDSEVVPLTPVLSAPVTATNSAQITLRGFNEKGATVILLQNGTESLRTQTADDGSFNLDVTLQDGENSLEAYSVLGDDSNQKQSAHTPIYIITLDTEAPTIDLSAPKEGDKVQGKKNQLLTVSGSTDQGSKVTVNDRLVHLGADGTFTTVLSLNNGDNQLTVKATDRAGNTAEQVLKVSYQE